MRKANIKRKTKETAIKLSLNLDGEGEYRINTPLPFMNHMLSLFAKHGTFDLMLDARGDVEVDEHHLVEDIGICLGEAIKKAVGDKKGISRYGNAAFPMDETLTSVSVDVSGRPFLVFNVSFEKNYKRGDFDFSLLQDFFQSLSSSAGITLHVKLEYGRSNHHIAESVFKGFSKALNESVRINPKVKGIPSTKGKL